MNVQKLINNKLLADQKDYEENHTSSGKWKPSQLGKCFRSQYWSRKGIEKTDPPDERALRIFKVGNFFHNFIQGVVKEEHDEVEVEKRLETDDILGYADIVTDDEVIELKSQHSRSFWWMEKSNYDIEEEKRPHILQVMIYAWILGKDRGKLVYISKDDLCIAEYGLYLRKWKDTLRKEFKILRKYWDNEELPDGKPRAYGGVENLIKDKKDARCGYPKPCGKYCDYFQKCIENKGGIEKKEVK